MDLMDDGGVDVVDEKNIMREDVISAIKRMRNLARTPKALKSFAIDAVFKHYRLILSQPRNPFTYLPNAILQDFLPRLASKLASKHRGNRFQQVVLGKPLNKFMRSVLNRNITEFNFFVSNESEVQIYLAHLLKKCPNISKIGLKRDKQRPGCYTKPEVLELKRHWPNLIHLGLQGYACKDDTLKLIQNNFPELESFEFSLDNNEFITMAGVECLSKLSKLSYLYINVTSSAVPITKRFDQELLADIGGKVPNLQRMYFQDLPNFSDHEFVEAYGKNYPSKKLIVKEISLSYLAVSWPSCLTVEDLKLDRELYGKTVDNIAAIASPVKNLSFTKVPEKHIYSVLKHLGQKLETLEIFSDPYSMKINAPLNVLIVLNSCPELRSFTLHVFGAIDIALPNCELTPKHFKNMQRFDCLLSPSKISVESVESKHKRKKLWALFHAGSEFVAKISLDCDLLDILLVTLRENPNCLKKVKTLEFALFENEDGEIVEEALDIARLLLLRSPFLSNINFHNIGYTEDFDHDEDEEVELKDYIMSRHCKPFVTLIKSLRVKLNFIDGSRFWY